MSTKIFTALAVAGALTFGAASAQATQFIGTWSVQVLNNADPGLVVSSVPGADTFDVTLVDHTPQSFDMFDIFTNEGSIEPDDWNNPKTVALTFNFTAPDNNNGPIQMGGSSQGYSILGIWQGGVLTWANDGVATFNWGLGEPGLVNPGKMTISVNGGTFNDGYFGTDRNCNWRGNCNAQQEGLTVAASFEWDNDPTFAPVPEPGTWALLIGGFGLTGAALRRRRTLALA